jgi:hypothetical protein
MLTTGAGILLLQLLLLLRLLLLLLLLWLLLVWLLWLLWPVAAADGAAAVAVVRTSLPSGRPRLIPRLDRGVATRAACEAHQPRCTRRSSNSLHSGVEIEVGAVESRDLLLEGALPTAVGTYID